MRQGAAGAGHPGLGRGCVNCLQCDAEPVATVSCEGEIMALCQNCFDSRIEDLMREKNGFSVTALIPGLVIKQSAKGYL